jgi:hypothetical protein
MLVYSPLKIDLFYLFKLKAKAIQKIEKHKIDG